MGVFRSSGRLMSVVLVVLAAGAVRGAEPAAVAWPAWLPQAPPLPTPTGDVVRVGTVEALFAAVANAKPGQTILVADGHYLLPRTLDLHADNLALRGSSGDPRKVVLDGAKSQHGELVAVTGCSGVTIADVTIQNIKWNGFKLNNNKHVHRVTIYHCVAHNIWQRAVKGVGTPEKDQEELSPRDCRIQYCLFYNDRPKQFSDDPTDTPQTFGGNYIGGIDAMQTRSWRISDNVFVGIHGRTREARGAIFLWQDGRDAIIERNVIIDCDCGICLGNSSRGRFPIHATGFVVRNNFLTRVPENGLLADYTRDCKILQNTIHDPQSRLKRLIRLVHDNDGLMVANNLLSGPPMRVETASKVEFRGNATKDLSAQFVDAAGGNLHLKTTSTGAALAVDRLPEVPEDIDRQPRRPRTTVGADEP